MAPPRQASVEAVDDDDDEIQEIPAPEQPQTQAPASAQPEMQAAEEPEWQVPNLSGYSILAMHTCRASLSSLTHSGKSGEQPWRALSQPICGLLPTHEGLLPTH